MSTVNNKHLQHLKEVRLKYQQASNLRTTLSSYQHRYQELQKRLVQVGGQENLKIRQEIIDLEKTIENLQQELQIIDNRHPEVDYYLKAGPILHAYYNDPQNSYQLHQQYKQELEQDLSSIIEQETGAHISEDICPHCQAHMQLHPNESITTCIQCGLQIPLIIESSYTTFSNQMHEGNNFYYNRLSHFKDHLAQVQAKESKKIPDEVYDYILYEMAQNNIKRLTPKVAKKILQKYSQKGFNKYYNNIQQIICKVNGESPLVITSEIENQLCTMFLQVQSSFDRHCPENRSNFLSYSYVLYKLCQILKYDHFLPYFKLLKSKDKLRQQDRIWQKICADNNWDFYPSV